ncbi:MAG: xylose isomerase [Balneolaceae bacterium]|nr:MAG: xylose isomerase [Balneolaceae bacterium]
MKIANAPCSWGILEFGLEGETHTYKSMLTEMTETGYTGTELGDWGFMPTDPAALKEVLDEFGLNLVGAFVPVNFCDPAAHLEGVGNALKIARLLKDVDADNARIVLADENGSNENRTKKAGRIKAEDSLAAVQWKVFAAGVERVARSVFDETGLPSVFHHHCAGFVETPQEMAVLMHQTKPELVSLCFDTGHFAYGGGDPVQGLKDFSERIGHVHFKDFDKAVYHETVKNGLDYFESVGRGIFCELGKGSVDFNGVLEELNRQNYNDWIVVEQDVLPGMGSPKESAQRNRDFLRSVGL